MKPTPPVSALGAPRPPTELSSFAARVEEQVASAGLQTALVENAADIAALTETEGGVDALDHCAARWIRADKTLSADNNLMAALSSTKVPAVSASTVVPRSRNRQRLRIPDKAVPGVNESDGTPVKVYKNEEFENWGGTIRDVFPRYTFVPKTRDGVVNVVKFARRKKLRVRVSGTRHSWTDIYGASNEVLVSMVELGAAEPLPGRLPDKNPADNELEKVELVRVEDGGRTALVKMGAAATSEHFRQWALLGDGDWKWMLNAVPVLVEITSAGSGQVLCHGAGINHQTVSDVVVEMEVVNCKGDIQVISDREELRAAAGCFGLLGVVLSQTFRCNRLELANLSPRKVATPIAVPPVSRDDVPDTDDFDVSKFTDTDLERARKIFLKDAHKFYSEWFWFPFNDECWINTWDTRPVPDGSERPLYPSNKEVFFQRAQSGIGEFTQKTILRILSGLTQAKLFSKLSMAILPSGEPIDASVSDAIHFRRGVHRMEVRDMELEVPIPRGKDGELDFTIVQKAWWMAISEVYREEKQGRAPMRVTLEMRIMGGSEMIMAAQRGNEATCAIEVLTNPDTKEEEWGAFIQSLTDKWASLKDPSTGLLLNLRPHWAKEWPSKIRGMEVKNYLKESYRTAIPEFKEQLAVIASNGNYTLQETFDAFGNDTILEIIGEKFNSAPPKQRRFGCTIG